MLCVLALVADVCVIVGIGFIPVALGYQAGRYGIVGAAQSAKERQSLEMEMISYSGAFGGASAAALGEGRRS